ncbi:MAG: homoaconitate hydratase, partial [Planctomycetes bacterium]|nr:homoaconitate hydratase [Planctomycetota bacterium]
MELTALSPLNPRLDSREIVIYDSTLRDGEQMPGVAFSLEQKVEIACLLDEIRVPQIEAGFPAVSEGEFNSIREIPALGLSADILALSRLIRRDIDTAVESGVDMALLFIATSDLHLKYKLKKSRECVMEMAVGAIEYCMERGIRASFSAEDSSRTDLGFLIDLFKAVEEVGVDRLGLTDTVGCASPEAITTLVHSVAAEVRTPLSLHLHDDFGMALPNAIAGVKSGARAITTTVNGIGERAGNVPLEQFVTAMKYLYGVDVGIDTTRLSELSEMVASFSRVPLPRNQPLVGENAFAHESGIHVAAVLNCPLTYESIPPEAVGNRRQLRMGKHTGVTYIRKRVGELGF